MPTVLKEGMNWSLLAASDQWFRYQRVGYGLLHGCGPVQLPFPLPVQLPFPLPPSFLPCVVHNNVFHYQFNSLDNEFHYSTNGMGLSCAES